MANTNNVLAGTGAAGTSGASLLWVAPLTGTGTGAPTDATTVLGTGWKDCGYISTDGATLAFSETKKDIFAYGVEPPVRELTTQSTETWEVTFLETNLITQDLYYRYPIGTTTAATGTGVLSAITTGPARVTYFQAVIDMIDGTNHKRIYAPKAQVTDRKSFQVQAGESISYGVTLTVYPDTSGNATYTYNTIPSLG